MTALSSAPSGAVAQAGEYLRHGDVDNVEQLLRFLADTFLLEGWGFEPPRETADLGVYLPGRGDVSIEEALAGHDPGRPTVGVCFYRSHRLTGNTAFVDELCAQIEAAGANAVAVWSYTLRRGRDGRVPALELLDGKVDALVTTMLATGGSGAADASAGAAGAGDAGAAGAGAAGAGTGGAGADRAGTGAAGAGATEAGASAGGAPDGIGEQWQEWDASAIDALDVPVIQAVCATASRAAWDASDSGLSPLDSATQVAIPEFDGRLLGGVISFKERGSDADSPVGIGVARYVPDAERCGHVARLAVRHARLRFLPASERRVALLLTAFPTKHAKVGMAVGLDTPASAVALLARLREEGMRVEHGFADGDELMHALIAAGGHDPEFLTDEQLAASPLRLPVSAYLERYAELDASLREQIEAKWGPPPGDRYLDGDDFVIAGLELGDVLVAIQPPRGYGEDPVGIYHDPELPPTHHYLAVYWWIERQWGADAIVHLGKHGTLEWLPGKTLALSRGCAPDATLGSLPLVYPFVVNDPGEGVQAKRRVHAVIVDHLIPPMMRADSYDELAQLEALLDEYARLEVLDPPKLPALAARIWTAIEAANLQGDLGVEERPDDLEELVEQIDGYLCEVKDIQIKDGLHVLGAVPSGPQLRGLVSALLRLGSGSVLGLRRAVGLAYGLDEEALVAAPGEAFAGEVPEALVSRFRGPAASNGDLVDRLEAAQMALLDGLAARGWSADAVSEVVARVLGVGAAGEDDAERRGEPDGAQDAGAARAEAPGTAVEVIRTLRFACEEVLPRVARTTEELDNVIAALNGRHVPAGPSGAPTRGRIDVLPSGRNFYSVDPRALPSELSWGVGVKLADALLDRHRRDHGELPRTVGLVAWGTAAMRTQGDDVAEILALLGVRPTWHPESQRVTGIEVIPIAELGRPRIDVTVRISGFFRDAFPHLVNLIDDAVAAVATLDEADEDNFVAAHARADAERLAADLGSDAAWRRATTRIFGSKPGTYGAGLLQLLETRDWRDDADLAEVYEAWGGYAYGRGLDGAPAREAMREAFARIDVAVKNVDSREHDILDSDDYYQYHGGMVATVRALTGRAPAAYLGDSSDPSRAVARTLEEETRRVFRARVANPRWIASMIRHGYKGAAELSATVDYLFGYDATAGVAEDWMYEQVAQKYLLDDDVAAFVAQSNPWAGRAIAEKLLEAVDRGMWSEPSSHVLDAVRDRFLALEGELEEAEPLGLRPRVPSEELAQGAPSSSGEAVP
nr:cobaltochelatase subunit CobN [Conexibacter arvalis]